MCLRERNREKRSRYQKNLLTIQVLPTGWQFQPPAPLTASRSCIPDGCASLEEYREGELTTVKDGPQSISE